MITNAILFLLFVILPPVVITLAVIGFIKRVLQFRGDKRNPFRRFCKKCGQQQDYHEYSWAVNSGMYGPRGWWEDMQMIADESCSCHKYSEYRG